MLYNVTSKKNFIFVHQPLNFKNVMLIEIKKNELITIIILIKIIKII